MFGSSYEFNNFTTTALFHLRIVEKPTSIPVKLSCMMSIASQSECVLPWKHLWCGAALWCTELRVQLVDCLMAKAIDSVIIHEARCLHEGIHHCRADKGEPSFLQRLAHLVGELRSGRDFAPRPAHRVF